MASRALLPVVLVAAVLSCVARATAESPATQPAAPTVEKAHPGLASGVLRLAAVKPLPESLLLRCGDLKMTEADLSRDLKSVSPQLAGQFEKNMFFLLEQSVTPKLLLQAARKQTAQSRPQDAAQNDEQVINSYLTRTAEKVSVSDGEVKEFYEANKDMCGGAALDQIKDQLSQYVLEQKRQEAVHEHVRTLGESLPIEVDANWTRKQAGLAMDNPVDKARASGKPTMVDFGATGCRPCDMMAPILKSLEKKHEGKAHILFVHVREQQILAARYGIRTIPAQVFFDARGKEVYRHVGFYPQDEIEKRLAQLGAK